jgi:hypothetical protein
VLKIVLGQRHVRRATIEGGGLISVEENGNVWLEKVGQEMRG